MTAAFSVITQNEQSFPMLAAARVVQDVHMNRDAASVILWQENRYTNLIEAGLGKGWATYYGGRGTRPVRDYLSPISWDTDRWKFVAGGKRRLCTGIPRVVETRYITWVRLRDRTSGRCHLFVSLHPIAGAWLPGQRSLPKLRKAVWTRGMGRLDKLARRLFRRFPDDPLLVGMDANDPRGKPVGGRLGGLPARTVRGAGRIDYLVLVPAPRWRVHSRTTLDRHSDHGALKARVSLGGAR